tara:strand:+ start:166 stop:528 length:363 start_codon:yes stop_codon:yes gene_type:complete
MSVYEKLFKIIKLPTEEIAEERRRKCKLWLIALVASIFGPAVFIYSYRQKTFGYAFVFLGVFATVIAVKFLFPKPPLSGSFFIPIMNWLFYSSSGPIIMHTIGAWNIADLIKKEAIKKIK